MDFASIFRQATLRFTDTSGVLGTVDLAFDLAPYVYIINKQPAGVACAGYAESENFGFQVRGLKADSLSSQIHPAHTVTSGIADAQHSCNPSQPFNFGAVGCGTGSRAWMATARMNGKERGNEWDASH